MSNLWSLEMGQVDIQGGIDIKMNFCSSKNKFLKNYDFSFFQ